MIKRALLSVVCSAPGWGQYNAHPRMYLTLDKLADLRAVAANPADPDYAAWATVKSAADAELAKDIADWPITGISNASPARVTVGANVNGHGMPNFGTKTIYMGGGTGAWAGLNSDLFQIPGNPYLPKAWTAVWVDSTHFDLTDSDSTSYGSYPGQAMGFYWDVNYGFMDGWISTYWRGDTWYNAAKRLGLAYQVLKISDPTQANLYAAQGIKVLNFINGKFFSAKCNVLMHDNGYGLRSITEAQWTLIDWLDGYGGLTTDVRNQTKAALLVGWDYCYTYAYFGNGGGVQSVGFDNNYLPPASYGGAGLVFGDEDANLASIESYFKNRWGSEVEAGTLRPLFGSMAGGFMWEGTSYGQGTEMRLLDYIHLYQTARSFDLDGSPSTLATAALRQRMYGLSPALQVLFNVGDGGACSGAAARKSALRYRELLGDTTDGRYAQWMDQNVGSDDVCVLTSDPVDILLYRRSTRTATDYRSTLGTYLSPGEDGMYVWKSDGTADATQVRYMVASGWTGSGHGNKVSEHVDIYHGADWIVPFHGQWWGGSVSIPGYSGADADHVNGVQSGIYSNSLFFDDGGVYLANTEGYYGGLISLYNFYMVPISKLSSNYDFLWLDTTKLHDRSPVAGPGPDATLRTVRGYSRALVNFHDGVIAVVDRLRKKNATDTAYIKWGMNEYAGTSAPSDGTWNTALNASKAWFSVTSPAGAMTTTVGYTAHGATSMKMMQVADTTPVTAFYPVSMIYVGSTSDTATTDTVTTDANHFGAMMTAGGVPHVVVYSITLAEGADAYKTNTITMYTDPAFTFTGSTGKCVVLDVAQGVYNYVLGGAAQGSVTVGHDHSAYFSCTGGSWALTRTGSATLAIDQSATLPTGVGGAYYFQQFTASGGREPYTWSRTSGALHTGMNTFPSAAYPDGATLDGTPTETDVTKTFTIRVTDADAAYAERVFSLTIKGADFYAPASSPPGFGRRISGNVTLLGGRN